MWMELMSVNSDRNSSKVDDPDMTWQHVNTAPLRNGSTTAATHAAFTEDSQTGKSGIVPALIAAALFITFLLALYAVLWKCMVSPPQQRKKSKLRVRLQPRTTV